MKNCLASKVEARAVLNKLYKIYPEPSCALVYKNPFELLLATILSAQCTDKRVNIVTPVLFGKYKTVQDFAEAELADVEAIVRSTGFFHNKARNIIACSQMLIQKHAGKVPRAMEDLIALPGVGRKTANVVLGNAFSIAVGIVVDTHVKRLSRRIGWTIQTDPGKIEQDLIRLLPKKDWINASHLLILHGRRRCSARSPNCDECELEKLCQKQL